MNTESTTKEFDYFIELVKHSTLRELEPYKYVYNYKEEALEKTKSLPNSTTIAGWNIKLKNNQQHSEDDLPF